MKMVTAILVFLMLFAPPCSSSAMPDYKDALSKSILFFEGQRSGKLPPNQRLKWRKDSALHDGSEENVDLVGGYYDAGDNVKFGLPMAFSITMLGWSVIEYGRFMGSDLNHAMDAIRWGTDYLLKATAHPGTVYVQVGDPNADHSCWERPEDMDTPRTVYKITKDNPGSEVAAETAAALAAASIVFKKSDPAYAHLLLQSAIKVSNNGCIDSANLFLEDGFNNKYRASYTGDVPGACPFYCSSNGFNDFLSAKLNSTQEFKKNADNFMCWLLPEISNAHVSFTPGGLIYKSKASNMQGVTANSFLLLTYASYLGHSHQVISCGNVQVTSTTLRAAAKRQVDYILGDNPKKISYMVGYGHNFPRYIHHRASSLPSITKDPNHIKCNEGFTDYFYKEIPNLNILMGAVVGGPDVNDQYVDTRLNAGEAEPTTYINAPLVGALASLKGHPKVVEV
ncbi:hypothetical protein KI387_022665 [Taxus chinensis]|uniref:Endoglucanase n=1 Tax=Taxus chinensis TaxID=29808 RepID=A0AA38G2K0_TAXCH|nr:hypothetical protein KI387_022665 [Taxus chinensis]